MSGGCLHCAHRWERVVGLMEVPGYPDEMIERTVSECRRFPPQRGFWGTSYPRAIGKCAEFTPKVTQ